MNGAWLMVWRKNYNWHPRWLDQISYYILTKLPVRYSSSSIFCREENDDEGNHQLVHKVQWKQFPSPALTLLASCLAMMMLSLSVVIFSLRPRPCCLTMSAWPESLSRSPVASGTNFSTWSTGKTTMKYSITGFFYRHLIFTVFGLTLIVPK